MLLLFYVLFFVATRIIGILAPQQGIKFTPFALEGKVLTIRSPGKSPRCDFNPCLAESTELLVEFMGADPQIPRG